MPTKIKDSFEFNLQIALLRDSVAETQERLNSIMEYINANMKPPVTVLNDAPGKHKPSFTIAPTLANDDPDSTYTGKATVTRYIDDDEKPSEVEEVGKKVMTLAGAGSGD